MTNDACTWSDFTLYFCTFELPDVLVRFRPSSMNISRVTVASRPFNFICSSHSRRFWYQHCNWLSHLTPNFAKTTYSRGCTISFIEVIQSLILKEQREGKYSALIWRQVKTIKIECDNTCSRYIMRVHLSVQGKKGEKRKRLEAASTNHKRTASRGWIKCIGYKAKVAICFMESVIQLACRDKSLRRGGRSVAHCA